MLDPTDIALLVALQRDAHMTAQHLSEQLNLSASQAGRRRQRLEAQGYIRGYVAQLDPERIGLTVQAFIQVHFSSHGTAQSQSFANLCDRQDAIVSAWALTGEADYLLRVFVPDLASLNSLIQDILLPHSAVGRVHSQIVMDQLKRDGPLPTQALS